MRLKTIYVAEIFDDILVQVCSFSDDEQGQKEAKAMFSKVVKKLGAKKDEIKASVKKGHYNANGYQVILNHSM